MSHLVHPVLEVQLYLRGELLLVPAQPGQRPVRPGVQSLGDEPARGLWDREHQHRHHHLAERVKITNDA